MYKYQDFKQAIFSEDGQADFLSFRDLVLYDWAQRSRVFTGGDILNAYAKKKGACDNFQVNAYLDRMVELCEIEKFWESTFPEETIYRIARRRNG
jgi:hypothetical protein